MCKTVLSNTHKQHTEHESNKVFLNIICHGLNVYAHPKQILILLLLFAGACLLFKNIYL